jgi:hypothetical protein
LKSRRAWLEVVPYLLDLAVPYEHLLSDLGYTLRLAQAAVSKFQEKLEKPGLVKILDHYKQNIGRRADLVEAFNTGDKAQFLECLKSIIKNDPDPVCHVIHP